MKVHITLKEEIARDPHQRDLARRRIVAVSGLREINEKRLARYGILSGSIDPDRFESIAALAEVKAIEEDETKSVS